MDKDAAIKILSAMANALSDDPHQFALNINTSVIGTKISQNGPGTGLHVSVSPSGNAKNVIGFVSKATSGDIESGVGGSVTKGKADPAMVKALQELSDTISAIAEELKQPAPDKAKVRHSYSKIVESQWAPAIVSTVLEAVLDLAFK
ncbi:MAG: hypothetical protein HQL41_08525 [Alphaproteobacteria bacterium]|nr:hypothetical protein [Alphaproteobacteria bacterium]